MSPSPAAQLAAPLLRGIDVSGWQGEVRWDAVAAAGYAFASCKLTEGRTFVDSRGLRNLAAVRALGLRGIAYHYMRENDPAEEAQHFLDVLGLDEAALPPVLVMLDVEHDGLGDDAAERALTWLRTVAAARDGALPFLYTFPAFAKTRHFERFPGLAVYPPWIADFRDREAPEVPAPWSDWAVWQQTDRHHAPGVATPCDLDVARAVWL